jgi:hypothetical protein
MNWFDSWALTLTVLIPAVGALVLMLIPRAEEASIKWIALLSTLAPLGVAVGIMFRFKYSHTSKLVGKTMNNLLLWISAVGLIEAGRLAETTGIDLVKLRDALQMSSGASAALNDWDMITFTWALKDMQVVAEMSDKACLALPITGAIKELVKDARRIKASNAPDWTGSKGKPA